MVPQRTAADPGSRASRIQSVRWGLLASLHPTGCMSLRQTRSLLAPVALLLGGYSADCCALWCKAVLGAIFEGFMRVRTTSGCALLLQMPLRWLVLVHTHVTLWGQTVRAVFTAAQPVERLPVVCASDFEGQGTSSLRTF